MALTLGSQASRSQQEPEGEVVIKWRAKAGAPDVVSPYLLVLVFPVGIWGGGCWALCTSGGCPRPF